MLDSALPPCSPVNNSGVSWLIPILHSNRTFRFTSNIIQFSNISPHSPNPSEHRGILTTPTQQFRCWLPLRGSTLTSLFASLLSSRNCPLLGRVVNCLVRVPRQLPPSHQLSFASPYHFRIRRDFMSKNPLSGFAPKQTRLLWRPTHIVLQTFSNEQSFIPDRLLLCKNCEAYSSFEGVSYDHRIVTAKIRLSLRKNATRTMNTIHYD